MKDNLLNNKHVSTGSSSAPHGVPLQYEAPADHVKRHPNVNVLGVTFVFLFGFVAASLAFGMITIDLSTDILARDRSKDIRCVLAALYFLCFIFFANTAVKLLCQPGLKSPSRWIGPGGLVGMASVCLGQAVGLLFVVR
jgi:hypothetical protein